MLMQRKKSIAPSNTTTTLELLRSFLKSGYDELQTPARGEDTGSPSRHKSVLSCKKRSTRQSLSTPEKFLN